MPFGLKNVWATYQYLVNKLFEPLIGKIMEVCVDDMIAKSKTDGDHDHDLRKTFDVLRAFAMKLNPKKCVFGVWSGKFLSLMISSRGIEANPNKIQAVLDMKPPRNIREVQRLTGCIATLGRFISRSAYKCQSFFRPTTAGQLQLGSAGGRGFLNLEDIPGSVTQNRQPPGRGNLGPIFGYFRARG